MKKAAIVPDEPFSGETMPVDVKKDKDKWSRLIKSSRDQFTIVYSSKQQITKIVYKEESAEKQPKSNTRTGLPA
jgi:CRISPR/Cas system-associated endoribonuclease Cas2